MAPLNLVKGEIDATLSAAENAVQKFIEDASDTPSLQSAMELLNQLLGVLRIINMDGPAFMVQDILLLSNHLLEKRFASEKYASVLSVLGQSMIVLSHYLNFIHLRQKQIPVLLVPTLNEIRRVLGSQLITEFEFAIFENPIANTNDWLSKMPYDQVAIEEIPERCRRLRSMYQVGLLGIIRDENTRTNLKVIYRAMERIARICGDVPITKLWWLTCASIQAFISGEVEFTVARKVVFRKIDVQLKRLISEGVSFLNQRPTDELLQECLYILALSQNVPGLIEDIKAAYNLLNYPLSDVQLRQEYIEMNGLNGSVIATAAASLFEELMQLRETLELGTNGILTDQTRFGDAEAVLTRVISTLWMLGLTDAAVELKKQLQMLQSWTQSQAAANEAELLSMADALMQAVNAIDNLKKRYVYDNIPHVSSPSNTVSISQIDESRLLVVVESRVAISVIIKAITSFIESQFSPEHIQNVPESLHSVAGALKALELNRVANVLMSCKQFINKCISNSSDQSLQSKYFDSMVDALCSVDYYLEGMEEGKSIGEGVLQVAEESISDFGVSINT